MKKPRLVLSALIGLVSMCVTALAFSAAWYSRNSKDVKTEIAGSVLQSYFDKYDSGATGDPGSQTNPFVITTPTHYENLIKLYTQKIYDPVKKEYVDFSSYEYYFEIGKQFKGSTAYTVYDVDKYGVYHGNTATELNLESLGDLEPLGNDLHPFISHIEGHGIIVKNFTVKPSALPSEAYNDIGIFGFVNLKARIKHTYWTNFIIDTTGGVAGAHSHSSAFEHASNVRIGYLAGHVKTYENFEECYVNNCRVQSPKLSSKQATDYGIYGICERDQSGGGVEGHSYSYAFDSQIWHQYFNANLDAIGEKELCLRNHTLGDGQDVAVPGNTFSQAVTQGGLGQYTVNGHNCYEDYDGYDYSLSTAGYISGERIVTTATYPAKYLQGSDYKDPDSSALLTSLSPEEQTQNGYWYYRNGTEWDYYYTKNGVTKGTGKDKMYYQFYFAGHREYMITTSKSATITYELYLDNQTTPFQIWVNNGTPDGLYVKWPDASLKTNEIDLGEHSIALLIHKQRKYGIDGRYEWNGYIPVLGSKRSNTLDKTTAKTDYYAVYEGTTCKFTTSSYDYKLSSYAPSSYPWTSRPSVSSSGSFTPVAAGQMIRGMANFTAPMYYYIAKTNQYIQLKDTSEVSYENAVFKVVSGKLNVTITEIIFDPATVKHNFVGDEKEVAVDPAEDQRYKSKNIDIVGGGIDFYYYSLLGFKMCRVMSESAQNVDNTIVKKIGSSDIGKPFYATKYCRQSIVLYVSNVGNALDNVNDTLGSMSFAYYQLTGLGMNTCHPSFKKGTGTTAGSSNFIEFKKLIGDPEATSGFLYTYNETALREQIIQKASYCCLDADGKILGTYNSDGSTTLTDKQKSQIATYVVAIGAYTNSEVMNWRLWIQKATFKYTAKAGEGGNFGPVEFRSSPNTAVSTMFTFYIPEIPTNVVFYIDVKFTYVSATSGTYDVKVASSASMKITFYNYFYNAGYALNINGTAYTDRITEYTVGASSINYANLPKPSWAT